MGPSKYGVVRVRRRRTTNWVRGTTQVPGLDVRLERPGRAGRDLWPRRPARRIVHTFARYGTLCGGSVWRRPWRGRNATRRAAASSWPGRTNPRGGPYGASTFFDPSRTSSSNAVEPYFDKHADLRQVRQRASSVGSSAEGPSVPARHRPPADAARHGPGAGPPCWWRYASGRGRGPRSTSRWRRARRRRAATRDAEVRRAPGPATSSAASGSRGEGTRQELDREHPQSPVSVADRLLSARSPPTGSKTQPRSRARSRKLLTAATYCCQWVGKTRKAAHSATGTGDWGCSR